MIFCFALLHGLADASEYHQCSDTFGLQVIQSDLDLSNVTKILISIESSTANTNVNATSFENATFTIVPFDGNEIIISSNFPNIYKPKFHGRDGYNHDDNGDDDDGLTYEEDTTTLVFETIDLPEVLSSNKVVLEIKFPRYQLLDLHLDKYDATVFVLPGFDNLKSIHASTNLTLYAQLTAPITNFTIGKGGGNQNDTHYGKSTFFTIEQGNSTYYYPTFISMIFKKQGVTDDQQRHYGTFCDLAIQGTITQGATSYQTLESWQQYYIFVRGAATNFELNFGSITISDKRGCSGVSLGSYNNSSLEYDMLVNPSCQQSSDDFEQRVYPNGDEDAGYPEPLFECANSFSCDTNLFCFSPKRPSDKLLSPCFAIPSMCFDSTSASTEVNGGLHAIQCYGIILMLVAFVWY